MSFNFDDLSGRLTALSAAGRLRELVPRSVERTHVIDPTGRRLLNFGGNDYLGLACEALPSTGQPAGSGASPLVCGWTETHDQLARLIAQFESTESAVLFPSGFAAGSGAIASLAEQGDLILSDQLNHASLIDGCRLSRATCVVYPHRDCGFVRQRLAAVRDQYKRVWIVSDGVFSMDGDVAPLPELCEIAKQFDACVMVDEAHGTGVLGRTGSGVCEALGVKEEVPIRIGTLSKAIGCQGGFVAGPKVVVDFLINHCRSLIFSTSLAPHAVAASLHRLQVIQDQPERRQRVSQLARQLRNELSLESGDALEAGVPIVPVIMGGDEEAVSISRALAESGFFVPAIRPPTVPAGTARLRISLSAAHHETMVHELAQAILRLRS